MEANVLQVPTPPRPRVSEPQLVARVTDLLAASQSTDVWARGAGRHVLLGLEGQGPFARLTSFGSGCFGLAFHNADRGNQWELLLVDDLAGVIEHALVACTVDRT
jgi:hypothetical protein